MERLYCSKISPQTLFNSAHLARITRGGGGVTPISTCDRGQDVVKRSRHFWGWSNGQAVFQCCKVVQLIGR